MTTPDSAARFADRATDYARHRPGWPDAARALVLADLGPLAAVVAADIGAGTGLSARWLAEAGATVHAIEPGAAMRAQAAPHARVHWHATTAAATGLPAAGVDLVLCAQSFHWFAEPNAVAEFARILRPGGRLAILWHKKDAADPFTAAFRDAVAELVGDAPAETFAFAPAVLGGAFAAPVRHVLPQRHPLDADGVLGLAMSGSWVPRSGPVHDEIVRRLRAAHARHADAHGNVQLHLHTEAWLATRR